MQLRFTRVGGAPRWGRRLIWFAILALVLVPAGRARAADAPPMPPAPEAVAVSAPATPATGGEMSSAGWVGLRGRTPSRQLEARYDQSRTPRPCCDARRISSRLKRIPMCSTSISPTNAFALAAEISPD